MKITWREKGRSKEYGRLSVPVSEELELDKSWDGRKAHPIVWIDNGRLYIAVKRDLKKEAKRGKL